MAQDWRDGAGIPEVLRLVRDQGLEIAPDAGPLDVADLILDHEEKFRGERRLLNMLATVLVAPFDRLCREHVRANCLLIHPQGLAEAAVVDLIISHFFGTRRKPLAAFARALIARTSQTFGQEPHLLLWQPDAGGSEVSRLLHLACRVVNGMRVDVRRLAWLAWVDRKRWEEIEPLTGHHPEQIEAILGAILRRAYDLLAREERREGPGPDRGEMERDDG